jgi:hypothetical protein
MFLMMSGFGLSFRSSQLFRSWRRLTTFQWMEFLLRSVTVTTGYGLDDWEVGVRVPVGSRIFTSPCCPGRLWGPPNLLYNGYRGLFPGGKAAGAWSWPLTSN